MCFGGVAALQRKFQNKLPFGGVLVFNDKTLQAEISPPANSKCFRTTSHSLFTHALGSLRALRAFNFLSFEL